MTPLSIFITIILIVLLGWMAHILSCMYMDDVQLKADREKFHEDVINIVKPEEKPMTIHDFAVKVTKLEGKKKSISIAQVKEVLKITNKLTNGCLYKKIKEL